MTEEISFLVVTNHKAEGETIYYCGDSELEARRKFNTLKGMRKNIIKANVFKQNIMQVPFIMKYDIIEIIK